MSCQNVGTVCEVIVNLNYCIPPLKTLSPQKAILLDNNLVTAFKIQFFIPFETQQSFSGDDSSGVYRVFPQAVQAQMSRACGA